MTDPAIKLSIIIPAFNEEMRLPRALVQLRDYFAARRTDFRTIEILVVDDGSADATAQIVEKWTREWPCVRLVSNGRNRGKGYSVRHGMLEARGRISLFTDADLSSPIEESEKLLAAIRAGNQVAIGSRAMDRSLIAVRQSRLRELAGMIFNGFVRVFTGLPFQDTQCGFKAFTARAAQTLFPRQKIERWGFDPELLFLARKFGLPVREVAVKWAHDDRTKISYLKDGLHMGMETLRVRWYSLTGQYSREAPECVVDQA